MSIAVLGYEDRGYKVSKARDGVRWYKFGEDQEWKSCNNEQIPYYDSLISVCRKRCPSEDDVYQSKTLVAEISIREKSVITSVSKEDKVGILNNLINFFSEFFFEPNFRFVNTFCYMVEDDRQEEYVLNYFRLTDSPYVTSIQEKMKSPEWKTIVESFKGIIPSKKVNKRFKIFYGSQGTGKTTIACKETDGRCVVCHSAVLPSDIMEDFSFSDGKAQFTPSMFYKAMTEGYSITLDEINLLPFDTLRFLQSVLDGKKEFTYKGIKVRIKDGFSVIGTMNLSVNGCTYSLPDPLVDRAYDLVEFKLTAENLVDCIS